MMLMQYIALSHFLHVCCYIDRFYTDNIHIYLHQSAQVNFSELTRLIMDKSVELATLDKVVVHFHPRVLINKFCLIFNSILILNLLL